MAAHVYPPSHREESMQHFPKHVALQALQGDGGGDVSSFASISNSPASNPTTASPVGKVVERTAPSSVSDLLYSPRAAFTT